MAPASRDRDGPTETRDRRVDTQPPASSRIWRRASAEGLGTLLLVAAVVGSGIMAEQLTGDVGLQLLINALSTVCALGVLIALIAAVSGAHLNPAVTLVAIARGETGRRDGLAYVAGQLGGAMLGVALANTMFSLPPWHYSQHARASAGALLGEAVATAGLVWVIATLTRAGRGPITAVLVPAWIGAAYFFTASTSFANPAVTLGRAFSDTFSGIAPVSLIPFVLAQIAGAAVGALVAAALSPDPSPTVPVAHKPEAGSP